jgi:hypothetical protein
MKILSTRVHGILDYLTGVLLIALPWILGFNDVPAATWTVIFVGAMIITLSLFTNYESGIVRSIPMAAHLNIDIITPWLFGFADQVYLPHLVMGIFETAAALITSRHAQEDQIEEVQALKTTISKE